MHPTISSPARDAHSDASPGSPFLLYERLDCYRLALEFQAVVVRALSNRRVGSNLRDQLDRASTSIALNIAEGGGRSAARDKAHFFAIARGSAMECGAVLDLLIARSLLSANDHRAARNCLIRIVQMLTRLIVRQRVE